MKLKVSQFFALILMLLVTGVFWGTWFSLGRSMEVFSAEEFIHIGKTIIANLATPMRIIMPASLLFIVLSMWFYPDKKSAGFYLCVLAFLLSIVALYITVGIEVPIDNQIKEWTASTVPPDWQSIRNKWEFFHTMRTFVSLAGFASFTASIIFPNKNQIK